MNAIEILSNEHGLIRQFLDNLALASDKIEEGKRVPKEFFEKGVDFARSFADRFHHSKEEHVMFVRLAQQQQGEIDAQIEALRHEHERGRSLVTEIAEAAEGYAEGDSMRMAGLLVAMAGYSALLRHHIHTEDHVFFPLAKEQLTDDDMAAIAAEFENEHDRHGADTFERCHKLVVDMGSMLVHM
jgi:hemerythrin-like domain-containing protein